MGLGKVGTGTKFVAKAVGNKTVKVKNNVKSKFAKKKMITNEWNAY